MSRLRTSRHATVVAYLALFVALSGTAYAATGDDFLLGHVNQAGATSTLKNTGAGPALRLATQNMTTPPFAVSNGTKITHLNADELDGLSSSAFQGKAAGIDASRTSPSISPVGHVGPWTVSLNCKRDLARVTVTGPGNAGGMFTVATGDSAGFSFIRKLSPIGSGSVVTADNGQQLSQTLFLESDTTLAQVDLLVTAEDGGVSESCHVIGAGTLIAP